MEKIEYEGETYYYLNNKFVDSHFVEVSAKLARILADAYFKDVDYSICSKAELLDLIKKYRDAELYSLCIKASEYALKCVRDRELTKAILPMLSSSYRKLNMPQKAVALCDLYFSKYYQTINFLTSCAAAYCDLREYVKAKSFADMAYAIQGGSVGYKNELSLVYERIKKESDICSI